MPLRFGSSVAFSLASLALCYAVALAQFDPEGMANQQPAKGADDPIKLVYPVVDKKAGTVTLPAAFWNQKMTNWVEVAVCGRPSDFLHETIVCVTTTKSIMMQAMHAAGFHDADAWTASVRDFPRIRGDRFIILLKFTRPGADAKEETYALDELLSYQGWGVSAGPYGWMFKGDPEHDDKAAASTEPPAPAQDKEPDVADRTKILRDDPQIALVLKGIQHTSMSFADHPLVYDDWVYPMMRYGRNYRLLPSEIYDSNGTLLEKLPAGAEVKPPAFMQKDPATGKQEAVVPKPFPVTMVIQKVDEEQFITEMAKVWHDKACAEYMLKQLPTARQIDKDKAALWAILPKVRALQAIEPQKRDAAAAQDLFGQLAVLSANIEKGYATLDAAWADWAADHAVFETDDNKVLDELKDQAKVWREHMDLRQKRAEQLAIAQQCDVDMQKLDRRQPQTDAMKSQHQKLLGEELEARSNALLAENVHERAYWKFEQGRLDPTDPRTDWIKHIAIQVEFCEAREATGTAGLAYGRALQAAAPDQVASAKKVYLQAVVRMRTAEIKRDLTNVDFEISKRVGLEDAEHPDPELPKFRAEKKALEEQLKEAQAATQPATPATQTGAAP